jgi:hypothetical protein
MVRAARTMTESHRPRPPRIHQHLVRKEWGYAVLLEEHPDRRTFRFEDGTERSFRSDYFEKMVPLDLADEEASGIAERALRGVPTGTPAARARRREPRGPKKPELTVEEQLARFREAFPLGFDDVQYPTSAKGRALRRAKRELAQTAFGAKVEAEDFEGAHAAAVAVVEAWKSSVPKGDRARLKDMDAAHKPAFARALAGLLYGEGPFPGRFDAFVRALDGAGIASWQVATIFPALAEPEKHILVRGTFLRKQALILDVSPGPMNPPRSSTYERLRTSVERLRDKLTEAGEAPKDLLDVVAFSKKTLAPKK